MREPRLPFDVVTTRFVVDDGERIEIVRHDVDGTWSAEGETDVETDDDVRIVPLDRLAALDPSLADLPRIPAGWYATRFGTRSWHLACDEDDVGETVPVQGYELALGAPSAFAHRFCGEHDIAGAYCPNCAKPLLRLMSLDTSDPRLELRDLGAPFVHLVYCWTCDLAQGASYRLRSDDGVELLVYGRSGVQQGFPYADYPASFPGESFDLVPVTVEDQALLDALNAGERRAHELPPSARDLGTPRHQVGGRPRLLQGAPRALCPECARPMALLASCGDEAGGGGSFAGNPYVQVLFLLCVRDRIVTSTQQCD